MSVACRITVRIRPGAKHNGIAVDEEGNIAVSVTSPPVDGKANEHLVKMLSKALHLPKSAFSIVMGQTNRDKVIDVDGMEREEIVEKLKIGTVKKS